MSFTSSAGNQARRDAAEMNLNPSRALVANYTPLFLAKLLIRQTQDQQRHRFDSLVISQGFSADLLGSQLLDSE